MATSTMIDKACANPRTPSPRGFTDHRDFSALQAEFEVSSAVRREAGLWAAGWALQHACTADPEASPPRECDHPDHAVDVERLRERLDVLGLLRHQTEAPRPESKPEPETAPRPVRRRLDVSWAEDGACRGESLALFFGPDGERQPVREVRERKAKSICAQCPVRRECLDFALTSPERAGTWGGLNEEERAAERRRRQRRGELPASPAPVGGKGSKPARSEAVPA
jgi:WhiB family redox-sensing transcriptional regulator